MARGKRKKKARKGRPLDVEKVLSGGVQPTAIQLAEVIHRINPTGDSHTADELGRRYDLKSRLQSLFVDKFREEVEVRPGQTEGVVLLVHRPSGADACHAIVADLEPDARSWVQWQIDEANVVDVTQEEHTDIQTASHDKSSVQRSDETDRGPLTVETLIRLGQEALEAFDYQEAETCFEEAYSLEPGNAGVASQLLEFFVEHLGAYEEGLALISGARFPLTDKVRVLGAVAAARAQRFHDARTLARGVRDERLGEVWLSIADDAIKAGRWDDAIGAVETARKEAPNDMRYLPRAEAIDQGRAAERRPLELALQTLVGQGLHGEAEAGAMELLERWPDSSAAKRILAKVEAHNRAALLEQEMQLAEEARAKGDDFSASAHFRKAIDLGGEKEKVLPKIAAAQASLKERKDTARVDRTIELLSLGDLPKGLTVFLELEVHLRERVREQKSMPILSWIDQLSKVHGGKRHRSNLANAVIALAEATDMAEAGALKRASKRVAPFSFFLESLQEYSHIVDAERKRAKLEHRRAIDEAFSAFEAAVEKQQFEQALIHQEKLKHEEMSDERRMRFEQLSGLLQRRMAQTRLSEELDTACRTGDFLKARRLVEALGGDTQTTEPGRWQSKQLEVESHIQRKWKLWRLTGRAAQETGVMSLDDHSGGEQPRSWISPDGDTAVECWARGRWIFCREVDLETSRSIATALARTEQPMTRFAASSYDGEVVSLVDTEAVVEFDVVPWRVRSRTDIRRWNMRGETVEEVFARPRSDRLWLFHSKKDAGLREGVRVINRKTARDVKELGEQGWDVTYLPLTPPRMATFKEEWECCLWDERGSQDTKFSVRGMAGLYAVQVHPDGEQLVFLANSYDDREWGTLTLQATDLGGHPGASYRIPDSNFERIHEVATSTELGLVFVLCAMEGIRQRLLAFRATNGAFELLYELEVPVSVHLVRDIQSRHVLALATTDEGAVFVRLDSDAPAVSRWRESTHRIHLAEDRFLGCHWPSGVSNASALALFARLRPMSEETLIKEIERHAHDNESDHEELLAMAHAISKLIGEERERLLEKYIAMIDDPSPIAAELQLLRASEHLWEHGWQNIESHLRACDERALDPASLAHFYHLSGLDRYFRNDLPGARLYFERLAKCEESCTDANTLLSLTRGSAADGCERPKIEPCDSKLRRLIGQADQALTLGDTEAALLTLDTPFIWNQEELQSLARLCDLLLEREHLDDASTYRKVYLLANFVYQMEADRGVFRRDISIGENQWDADRLEATATRAKEWLDGFSPGAD